VSLLITQPLVKTTVLNKTALSSGSA